MTIAVNLNGPAESPIEPVDVSAAPESPSSPIREKINRFIGRLQPSTTSGGSRDWGAYEIAIQAFDAMQSAIARQKLAAYPPDTVIEIAQERVSDVGVRPGSRDDRIGIQKGQDVRLHDFGWQALAAFVHRARGVRQRS